MSTTVVLVVFIVFAFAVTRGLGRFTRRATITAGSAYLVVGVALGPWVSDLFLDSETVESLSQVTSLLLGVLGFMIGLRTRESLRDFEATLAGTGAAVIVLVAVSVSCLAALSWALPGIEEAEPLLHIPLLVRDGQIYSIWITHQAAWMSLTLGAAACVSSSSIIEMVCRRHGATGSVPRRLQDLATSSQAVAILGFAAALAGEKAAFEADKLGLNLIDWVLLTGLAGIVTGVLFTIFSGADDDPIRVFVASIGVIIFATGVGTALGISSLFVNFAAGVTVAATSPDARRLRKTLRPLHQPVAVLILVFAGAAWTPARGLAWVVVLTYVAVRILARVVGTRIGVATFIPQSGLRRSATALLPQGALAAGIVLSSAHFQPEYNAVLTSAILLPMLVLDLLGARVVRATLANAGALSAVSPVDDGAEEEEERNASPEGTGDVATQEAEPADDTPHQPGEESH